MARPGLGDRRLSNSTTPDLPVASSRRQDTASEEIPSGHLVTNPIQHVGPVGRWGPLTNQCDATSTRSPHLVTRGGPRLPRREEQ